MTHQEIIDGALARVAEIDKWFEEANGWGSWMVGMANEREGIVNALLRCGVKIEHKWQARCGGKRTD